MDVKKTQLFLRGVIAHPSMLVTILISTFFFVEFCRMSSTPGPSLLLCLVKDLTSNST